MLLTLGKVGVATAALLLIGSVVAVAVAGRSGPRRRGRTSSQELSRRT